MADFSNIYNEIDANVNANGQQKITGPILNKTLKDMLQEVDSEKQDTLVAGQNITIQGNVISATGGGGGQTLTPGSSMTIDENNVINLNPVNVAGNGLNGAYMYGTNPILEVDVNGLAGNGLTNDGTGKLAVDTTNLQEKLQAGANIQISGNTISATDTTYGAGQGIEQIGNVFSVRAGSGLGFDANGNLVNTGGGGGGATYTAGSGIDIDSNNVISAKTGPGLLVDSTTNNIELDRSALNFLPLEGGILQNTTPANDTTLTVMDGMNEDYVKIVAPESASEKPHVEIFENGSGDTKFYYDHLERGTQTTINYPTQSGTLALTSDIPYAPVYSGGNAIDVDANTATISVNYGGGGLYLDGSNQLAVDYNSIPGPIAGNGLQDDGNGHLQVDTSVIQEKLVAGQNITISGNVISATGGGSGGNYLPLDGGTLQDTTGRDNTLLHLSAPNGSPAASISQMSSNYGYGNITIGAAQTDQTVLQNDLVQVHNATSGKTLNITSEGFSDGSVYHASLPTLTQDEILATQSDVNTAVSGKQDILTAGTGISIQGNVISATGGSGSSYSAGNGIDITNNTISVDATDLDGAGLTTNQNGELEVDTNVIQGKLTAGSGITINGNVISATGGSGGSLWTSGTGTDSLFAPGTGSDIDYVDPSDPSQGINNQSESTGTRSIATGSFTHATGSYSAAFGDNTSASGHASAAFGTGTSASYSSFAAGYYTQANGSYSAAFGSDSYAQGSNDFVSGQNVQTSGMTGNEAAFGIYNNTNNANGPYLFTIGDGELQEIYHEYGTAAWEPNPDDPESTDSWTEYVEVRRNAVDIKTNGDVFIEDIGGYDGTNSSNATRLQDVINSKQDTLTAGSGITIQNNVISATGGSGSGLWTSGTGTGSVMSPGAFQANGNNSVSGGDYTRSNGTSSIALGTSTTTTGLSAVAIGANSTAAGSYSVALGHGLGAVNSDETALGKFNNYIDTGTTAEKTFFTIGNGTSNNTKSNILEIKQNNDAFLVGIGGFDGTNASQALSLQTVINSKQNQLVSGVDIKTINGQSIVGGGDLVISGGTSYSAGTGISIDSSNVISNTAPDPGVLVVGTGNNSLKMKSLGSSANGAYSLALGAQSHADGAYSFAAGQWASASRNNSIAIGDNATSAADYALGVGQFTNASGVGSIALGQYGEAKNTDEIGLGKYNNSINTGTTAEKTQFTVGNGTAYNSRSNLIEAKQNNDIYVLGIGGFDGTNASSALTLQTVINSKQNQLVSGVDIKTINGQSIVGGGNLVISGGSSLWTSGTGQNSLVSPGAGASSQGSDASGIGSIVIGDDSNANGDYSFAHGQGSMANGDYSAAFCNSNSTGDYSFAAGSGADAQADYSVALGGGIVVSDNSDPENPIDALRGVAIGEGATVNGVCGLAFMGGTATGEYSVAMGDSANANEMYSTALTGSTASGNYSFAASSGIAHAHYSTALSGAEAFGEGAFAAGQGNKAYGYGAAAIGYMAKTYSQANGALITDPNAGEVALGRYNYSEQGIVFTVGCGYVDNTDPNNPVDVRQNAIAIDSTGKIFLKGLGGYTGTSTSGCTDLATFLSNL